MQILHFDWLDYYRSISNYFKSLSSEVRQFCKPIYFVLFPNKYFFVAEFIIAFFCPTSWVTLKQLDPSRSRATEQ